MASVTAQSWIDKLQLAEHIEGGWYSEVYRSPLSFDQLQLPATFTGNRNACTHIYFLLKKDKFSAFHRIKSDELWHFYSGDPLVIYEITHDGQLIEHFLGNNPQNKESLFTVIKANNWFASKVAHGGEYGLAGCTVAPGFDFEDFEMGNAGQLQQSFPQHSALIAELSR